VSFFFFFFSSLPPPPLANEETKQRRRSKPPASTFLLPPTFFFSSPPGVSGKTHEVMLDEIPFPSVRSIRDLPRRVFLRRNDPPMRATARKCKGFRPVVFLLPPFPPSSPDDGNRACCKHAKAPSDGSLPAAALPEKRPSVTQTACASLEPFPRPDASTSANAPRFSLFSPAEQGTSNWIVAVNRSAVFCCWGGDGTKRAPNRG